ncbi:MAG: hypothetical protein VCB60_11390, partial [Alphaproteobacteria bacterium]
LTAIKTEFTSGFNITDADDSIGRTLIGSAKNDTLSGLGGDDTFVMGGGKDILIGGAGDDTFQIAASSDITSGIELSGGAGNDTLTITSTGVSALNFLSENTSLATLETLNITGGATGGVAVSIGSTALNFTTLTADGTADSLSVFSEFNSNSVDLRGITLTDVETVSMTQASLQQFMLINASTTLTGLTTISGTVNGSSVDDQLFLNGDRDFSGVTFTNIDLIILNDDSGTRQTLGANNTTSFGTTQVGNFEQGPGSTTDIFDYESNLKSGNGTTANLTKNDDLSVNEITSQTEATNQISANANGVIQFRFNDAALSLDFLTSTSSEILTAVENKLESTNASSNITGAGAVAAGGVDTDSLLIFFEASSQGSSNDAAIIRYQEGDESEADFNGELTVFALFDSVSDFDNANII